jgi:hypothetical protein
LLEFYESDSLVEADEDTDVKVGGDAGTGPDAGGVAKSRRKTRSMVAKQLSSTAAVVVSAVKAVEKKKKRKRNASSPPTVVTPAILMPRLREVESEEEDEDEATEESPVVEDRPSRRSESPTAKRQRELVEKTSEDALRRGLETQRTATAAQTKMPAVIRPQFFRSKPRVSSVMK